MNEELIAKSSPKNAYAAPQLKVYGAMQRLTASGTGTLREGFTGSNYCKMAPGSGSNLCMSLNRS